MKARNMIGLSALAVAMATALPALATETNEVASVTPRTYYYVPASDYYYVAPRTEYYVVPSTVTTIRSDPYYVPPRSDDAYYYNSTPAEAAVYSAPPITVYGYRADDDRLITQDVADRIAADPRINGNIGISTYRSDVTLTGLVTTPGQAQRAGRDAQSVDGVGNVDNNIRSKVGSGF
jgi:hypothetical protein